MIERLKAMRAQGLSSQAIADALGVTRNAVIGKANRLGLCEPRKRKEKPDAASANVQRLVPRTEAKPAPATRAERAPRLPLGQDEMGPRSPPVAVPLPDVSHATLRLVDLTVGQCRWVCNDPRDGALFCGARVIPGKSWCRAHHAIVYQPWHARRVA
jgi:GcrA cell cycle regulator